MKFTVIGAGHGGQALAGFIAYNGYETTLYNRTNQVLEDIDEHGGIDLHGCIQGTVTNIAYTSNMRDAVENAYILMVCVPATAHSDIAKAMAPYLTDAHTVVLNPGRTLGAHYFGKDLLKSRCMEHPVIAETDTFLLTSRKVCAGVSNIMSLKKVVFLASGVCENAERVCAQLSSLFPMLTPARSLVYTSLSNIGSVFHPVPAVFNIGRIENKEQYLHYKQGITPSICRLIELIDAERVQLSQYFGCAVPDAKMWLKNVYDSKGSCLYELLQNTPAYESVLAPTEINTRYIYEDITTGIVPMYCMAKSVGSPCETMGLIIDLATKMFGYDFYGNGRHDVLEFVEKYHPL